VNLKLIVGLGNPGKKYAETRHNVGFMAVKELADKFKIININKDCESLVAQGKIKDKKVMLAQPLTYMNESGRAISKLVEKYDILLKNLLVIYDDLDLPAGKIRIKKMGGSGGHKGLRSIIEYLNTLDIKRIRIGIDRPFDNEVKEYVLQPFDEDQLKWIEKALNDLDQAVIKIINEDIDGAMNKFN